MSGETLADFREPMTCPACGSDKLSTSREEEGWVIGCDECGHTNGYLPGEPELFTRV